MSEIEADDPAPAAHEASEISYDEQRYPARPKRLRPRGRLRDLFALRPKAERTGKPSGDNPAYVSWLVGQSMLEDAKAFATQFSGQGSMWQNPFANPDPRAAIEKASVWFTAYPISMITKPGTSFLGTLGDEDLWAAFEAIGIDGAPHRSRQEGRRAWSAGIRPRAWMGTSTGSAPRSTTRSEPRRSSGRCVRWRPATSGW